MWLDRAEEDLYVLSMLDVTRAPNSAAVQCQQALEKCLKACWIELEKRVPLYTRFTGFVARDRNGGARRDQRGGAAAIDALRYDGALPVRTGQRRRSFRGGGVLCRKLRQA